MTYKIRKIADGNVIHSHKFIELKCAQWLKKIMNTMRRKMKILKNQISEIKNFLGSIISIVNKVE